MVHQYIEINRILRKITSYAWDGIDIERFDDNGMTGITIMSYLKRDVRELETYWPPELDKEVLHKLKQADIFRDILGILPDVEHAIDGYFILQPSRDLSQEIGDFLHPMIFKTSYFYYKNNKFRDAVFNAFVAIFDLIRAKTKLDKDGVALITETFSLERPKLIFSTIDSDSGRNEQKGFMQILQGAYLGIRNPKAHTLLTDLDKKKAAEYLIFASLLIRRVDEAVVVT